MTRDNWRIKLWLTKYYKDLFWRKEYIKYQAVKNDDQHFKTQQKVFDSKKETFVKKAVSKGSTVKEANKKWLSIVHQVHHHERMIYAYQKD